MWMCVDMCGCACVNTPPYRNKLDFPAPLGPVTSRLVPRGTLSVRSLTSVAFPGVTTVALSNAISSSLGNTSPRDFMEETRPGGDVGVVYDVGVVRVHMGYCESYTLHTHITALQHYTLNLCTHHYIHPHHNLPHTISLPPPCAPVRLCIFALNSTTRSAYPPNFNALRDAAPSVPNALNNDITTLVWYRMLLSMAARPCRESSGRRWPPKKGPMMRATATVAPRYFRKKSWEKRGGERDVWV